MKYLVVFYNKELDKTTAVDEFEDFGSAQGYWDRHADDFSAGMMAYVHSNGFMEYIWRFEEEQDLYLKCANTLFKYRDNMMKGMV